LITLQCANTEDKLSYCNLQVPVEYNCVRWPGYKKTGAHSTLEDLGYSTI